jgi:hypothetical protein
MSKNKMFVYLNRSSLSCDVLFVDSGEVVNMLFSCAFLQLGLLDATRSAYQKYTDGGRQKID